MLSSGKIVVLSAVFVLTLSFAAEARGKEYAKRVMCASDPGDAFLYQGGAVKVLTAGAK